MTREEKLKVLLHPEQYTDEQLGQMLDEANIPTPDANKEWQHFESKYQQKQRPLIRWAAMFIGVLMLSGIAFAAVQIINHNVGRDEKAPAQEVSRSDGSFVATKEPSLTADSIPQTRIFENTPLDEMVSEIAHYYNKVIDIQSEEAHELRLYYKWEPKDRLESVVDDLNHFDRVSLTIEGDKLIVKP